MKRREGKGRVLLTKDDYLKVRRYDIPAQVMDGV